MIPYVAAGKEYLAGTPDLSWSELIQAHFHCPSGLVISTPEYFVLARQVSEDRSEEDLLDTSVHDEDGRLLHVDALAGNWKKALRHLPDGIEMISFQRRDFKIHYVPAARFEKHRC